MITDYYVVLGVPRNATTKQIRDRFLDLARERHPDRIQGSEKAQAEEAFQKLTEAFNVLSDPTRRRDHDHDLVAGPRAQNADRDQLVRLYMQRGVQAYRAGNTRAAAESFELATKEDEENHRAWNHLALALSRGRGALPRARAAAVKACELRPMEADYWKLAGRLFAESGLFDQAEAYYHRALEWGADEADVSAALSDLKSGRTRRTGRSS